MKSKPMKPIQTTLILLLFAITAPFLRASDPTPTHTYRGEVAGVMCSACSNHVKTALSKLEGVTSVKVTRGEPGAPAKLEVVSSSLNLTREAAVKALGDYSKTYDIRSLKRVEK